MLVFHNVVDKMHELWELVTVVREMDGLSIQAVVQYALVVSIIFTCPTGDGCSWEMD